MVDFAYWWSCIGKGLQSMGLRRLVYDSLRVFLPFGLGGGANIAEKEDEL